MNIEVHEETMQDPSPVVIKVLGVGGAGSNAVNGMHTYGVQGVDFIAVNTDVQDLKKSMAEIKLQIGSKSTFGRGAGGKPDVGEKAANDDLDLINETLKGAHMVFITAGMGGGTGTGAAPVIAGTAKASGILTVGVVTKPFGFEGRARMRIAEEGINKMREAVDTLIIVPNQQLLNIVDRKTPISEAFLKADDVLRQAVQGISDLITETGFINIDFADAETIMRGQGEALMAIGFGTGDNRAIEAASKALDNPLLEDTTMTGATRLLINVAGGNDFSLTEFDEVVSFVKQNADEDAIIIPGASLDPNLADKIRVTVIATGFQNELKEVEKKKPKLEMVKPKESDFIIFEEWQNIKESSKRPDYLSPRNNYQEDDLEVPTAIRNQQLSINKDKFTKAGGGGKDA
jgi:cell division protein FtsZ